MFLTVSGVVAVLTSLLLGAFVGVVVRVLAGGSVGGAFAAGAAVASVALAALHLEQRRTFRDADFSQIDPQFRRRAA